MKKFSVAATMLLMALSPTQADNRLLGCFFRTYDKAHLANHPDQLVTAVKLKIYPAPDDATKTWFNIQIQRRGDLKALQTAGECRNDGQGMNCGVECDGGGAKVTPWSASTLQMTLESIRMTPCGEDPEVAAIDVTGGKDDKIFRLERVDDLVCEGMGL